MAGVNKSVTCAQSDSISDVVPESPCCVRLERISRYLESSGGQSKQDEASNEPAEAESDSGDSLFITQKPEPEEDEDDTSSCDFPGESKTNKRRKTGMTKKYRLPKYSFAFLSGRKPRSTELSFQQSTSLHYYAMKGFFKRVRELWEEDDVESLDEDGDCSPLSEGEEGKSEDEDIKVVERKRFLAPSKAKRRQTWCNQFQQEERRNAGNARQETSQGGQCKMLHKIPAEASVSRVTPLSLDTETDDGESSCRVLVEKERNDESVTSDGSLAQKETPETKTHLTQVNEISFQHKATEEDDDSDATVCEPPNLQRSPKEYIEKDRETSTTTTESQTDVLHIDNLSQTGHTRDEPESLILFHSLPDLISYTNNDSVHNETGEKNETDKDHESREEEKGQSQEEPEILKAATSVNVEVEETPSLSEDNTAEPPASQTSDELESNERNCMVNLSRDDIILIQEERDIPDSKKKEQKKAAEDAREEVDGNLESYVRMEDSVFSLSCNMENGGKKKKKKKRKRSDVDVEQWQSIAAPEPLNDDAEVQMKKKKRKKEKTIVVAEEHEGEKSLNRTLDLPHISEQLEESGNGSENTAATEETFESSHVKRKKHKKKQQTSSTDDTQNGQEGVNVNFSNDAVTLEESTGRKKKKKKTISEGVDISYTHEEYEKVEDIDNTPKTKEGPEDLNAELVTKKKKKKKTSESSRSKISDDNVTQSDDSVSMWGKEKKRTSSFLFADAEENDAQTHEEQNPSSQHVDAHVWGAENPAVSASDFETKSAEMAGNLEESKDGVRKKKKKRKMSVELDSVENRDFEEPNETCQSALPESTHAVKRKKKRMGNESELVTSMEGLESEVDAGPTDEAVVSKKKKKKKKKCKDEPCHVIQESSQTATEDTESESALNTCSSVSHKKKGKHEYGSEKSLDSRTSDQATQETLNMAKQASPSPETPGNQAGNDVRVKKKKKKIKSTDNIQPEGKSLTMFAEPQETKKKQKKERNKQPADLNTISSSPVLSSSDRIMTHNIKRRLHNPSEDFLTDF